jgi:Calx-beta domain
MEVFAVFEQWSVRTRGQRPGRLAAGLAALSLAALPFGGVAQAQSEDGLLVPSVPMMVVDAEAVTEGNSGQKAMVFPVAMSQLPVLPVKVELKTKDRTANAGSDYQATTVTLEFKAGNPLIQQVKVPIIGDTTVEPDETLGLEIVQLSGPATAVDKLGVGRILNDDQPPPPPALRIDDLTVDEPLSGTAVAQVRVSLSSTPASPVTFHFETVLGTGPGNADGNDLVTTSGDRTLTSTAPLFLPVTIKSGVPNEPPETFKMVLSQVQNASLADGEAVVTILDGLADIDPCLINPHLPGCEFPLPPTS